MRWRVESSVALGGSRSFLGVPAGAVRAEARRRSRLRSSAGPAGGVSAALIASSPLAVLKVPATDLPMAVVSFSKPSKSHAWPSQMASIPYAAVDIATDQPTFRASFLRIPLVVMILAIVLRRWWPRARRCLTCARQFIRQSRKKPSHLTGFAFGSNFRQIPSQSSCHFLALTMDGPLGLSEAKNHATSVFSEVGSNNVD
jgi:hypothetical protein